MEKTEEIKKELLKDINALKDEKGFLHAGLPRYHRLFGRDSLIAAWQLLDWDPEISRSTLEILSTFQGKTVNKEREEEPGKIIHETDLKEKHHPRGYFPFPYYGSVDSTPLYLILFSFYFEKTKDEKFLDDHLENILNALKWMEEFGDKDNDLFLEYQSKTKNSLFHQGWKDSFDDQFKIKPPLAIVEAQGYQYLALTKMTQVLAGKKDENFLSNLQKRAKKLKEEFNEKFWMQDLNYFALALDKEKQQKKSVTSNPGHLLFTGIVDQDKVPLVVSRLFQEDLWTPYGIRTHSAKEPDFDAKSYHLGSVWPHDNWIIAQGLKELGFGEHFSKIKNALLLAYRDLGILPEYYAVVEGKATIDIPKKPCHPQVWSLGALFNFLALS